MTGPLFQLLLGGLAFTVAEMALTHRLARRWNNYGIVDVVWSAGFAALALGGLGWCAGRFHDAKLAGWPSWNLPAAGTMTGMVVLWSLRLAGHLFVRVKSHHPVEDVRYAQLRAEWGAGTARRMFWFFQLQGALQCLLALPFFLVLLNLERPGPWAGLRPVEWLGVALWLAGLAGESVADRQLARFRADPANRGRVCQAGLWNWSRHPNYFFEWLVWVGFAVFALGSPLGWLGLLSPALMWHFLNHVTGIPMTEALSVKSRGDAYREYQRTTSPFFPWFKRAPGAGP